LYCYVFVVHAVCGSVVSKHSGLEEENDLLEVSEAGEEAGSPDAAVASSYLLRSVIAFSSISSVPRMCPGLLFLTSVSYTDPDQFVYKTQPPREQPSAAPTFSLSLWILLEDSTVGFVSLHFSFHARKRNLQSAL